MGLLSKRARTPVVRRHRCRHGVGRLCAAPSPAGGHGLRPKVTFFFLTGLIFSTRPDPAMNSILPAIPVHILGLLMFFMLVWPLYSVRRLVPTEGTNDGFGIHVAQVAVFAALACLVFSRLANVTPPRRLQRRRRET